MEQRTKVEMPSMQAEPQIEHEWLQKLVGEWTYEGEATMDPEMPSMKFSGTESVRSLGGLWIVAESQGAMPDGDIATMIMTLGYDPTKKHYVGTWIGSMMTHLWIYEGTLNAAGKKLTLDSVGPNMAIPGAMAKFKDAIELKSADHRVLISSMLDENGQWREVMQSHYRRRK